jgi:hypothetical protein
LIGLFSAFLLGLCWGLILAALFVVTIVLPLTAILWAIFWALHFLLFHPTRPLWSAVWFPPVRELIKVGWKGRTCHDSGILVPGSITNERPDDALKVAVQRLLQGDRQGALVCLRRIIADYPGTNAATGAADMLNDLGAA